VAALLVELRRIVTQVSLGLDVASRTFTGVVIAGGGRARCRSFVGIGPAVVSASIAVVGSRSGSRGDGGSALVLQSLGQIVRMVEMRDGLLVSDRTLATVVVADGGSACCRSFASSIGQQ
jgi:hypothetical protein